MEVLDATFLGINQKDPEQLKLFEEDEKKILDAYQMKKATLLALKQEVRRLELKNNNRDKSTLLSTKIPLIGPISKLNTTKQDDYNPSDSSDREVAQWEIKDNEIKIDYKSSLGSGAFAAVYKGRCRGKDVAVKILNDNVDETVLQDFKNEVAILTRLRHENLLLFMGLCTEGGKLKIVTELMPKGSVYTLLRKEKLSMRKKMMIARDTALGMYWLHKQGIYHLDLKPANLLVNDNWVVKTADFGISQFKGKVNSIGGTPNYMAPEVFLGVPPEKLDDKTDVYSFGMILWELVTERYPWQDQLRTVEDFIRVVGREGRRPEIPKDCPRQLRDLIVRCAMQEPSQRPSFEQIAESNIFYRIVMDEAIKDDEGKLFWEKYFLTEFDVPWSKFLVSLATYLNIVVPRDYQTDAKFVCLKAAFGESGKVSVEQFGSALAWYGPFVKSQSLITQVYSIVSHNGFFGEMSREDAERTLVDEKPGSFLVRLSATPGDYAVSAKTKQSEYMHFRVQKRKDCFVFDGQEYASLPDLIAHFQKGKKLSFKHLVTGSKLQQALKLLEVNDNKLFGYSSSVDTVLQRQKSLKRK